MGNLNINTGIGETRLSSADPEESPQAIQGNSCTIRDRPSISPKNNSATESQEDNTVSPDIDPSDCHLNLGMTRRVIGTHYFVSTNGIDAVAILYASFLGWMS